MGQNSSISWTTHTFNPWWGCLEVSPACDNCYARVWANRMGYSDDAAAKHFKIWGAEEPRRFFDNPKHWDQLRSWDAKARKAGERARVFIGSMCDWAEGRPDQRPHLERLWGEMRQTTWLDYLMLTKRPHKIKELLPGFRSDIWLGTTVENQEWNDKRVHRLLEACAAVSWLSCEPLLGRIDLSPDFLRLGRRAWVIVGGESGRNPRPMDVSHARYLKDQCLENGVAFHMKQMSGRTKEELEAIPEDLMIREYPTPLVAA